MREQLIGSSFVGAASLQFGVAVVLGKVAADRGLSVVPVLAIRFAIAAALLFAIAAATRAAVLPARGERARLAALGAFGYGVEAALFFLAIERGTASAVTLLFFVYPVIVAGVSAMLGVKLPGRLTLAALLAAVAGASLVVASAGGLDITPSGIALALGSATAFALYLIGADRTLRRTASVAGSAWVATWASLSLAAFSLATGAFETPDRSDAILVVGMGVATGGAFATLFAGLRLVGAVRTSIIAALEPLSTAVLAMAFLNEPVRAGTIAGGALILGGAVAASLARATSRPAPHAVPHTVPDTPA